MKISIKIGGMHCAGCSSACERALKKLNGVNSASVNLVSATADIDYNEKLLTLADISGAVENAGFFVTDDKDNEKKKR